VFFLIPIFAIFKKDLFGFLYYFLLVIPFFKKNLILPT